MKLSLRNILTLLTLSVLFHGVMELKSYLQVNFLENETEIKRKVNHALNGFQTLKDSAKKSERKSLEE